MSMPTVQVIGIEKSFLRTRALAGVTFDAGAGITGLLGRTERARRRSCG